MTRLLQVARHEVRLLRRTGVLAAVGGVLALLLGTTTLLGLQRQRSTEEGRRAFQELVRRQWEEQPDRHPHRVAHFGSFAFRPPSPLTFFEPGVDSFTGTSVFLEAHRRNAPAFSEAGQASGLLRFGEASLAFVLQLLVPLLLFCLAFRSVAGERERGTWGLLLSQGVSVRTLLAGKVLGLLGVAALALVPALLAVLLLGAASGGWTGELLTRAALLAAGYALFLLCCTFLGVLVSFWSRQSLGALLLLLGAWVVLWVALPRTVTSLAQRLHPSPSKAEFDLALARELRAVGDSHNPDDPFFRSLRERYLARHGVERVEALPVNFGGVVMREAEALTSRVQEEAHARLQQAHRHQDGWVLAAGALSPFLALRAWSMALAGTDARHAADFQAQAEAHRYAFIQRLNDMHTHDIRAENDRAQRLSRERWRTFPPFTYVRPPVRWALAGVVPAGAALLAWAAALLTLLVLSPHLARAEA